MGRPFHADELQAAAARRTGQRTMLSDFGDPAFRADLDALLDALNHDAQPHAAGRLALRRIMIDHLVNRLLLTREQQRAPGLFSQPLAGPLIVTGLPRSGTTLLHRMLAADPTHYGPPYWELAQPLAPSLGSDHRRWYAALTLGLRGLLAHDLDRKHFVAVDTPEEDLHTLGATFQSWYYWMAAPVYGYLDWYLGQDQQRKYREYRAWLQVVQAAHPGRRLVLKSPEHTGGLAALLDAVPEAHVVQLHRDPRTSFASFVSLTRTTQHMFTGPIDHTRSARASLSLLSSELRRNLAARDRHPGAVLDLRYDDLVADPGVTAQRIYQRFGLDWTDAAARALRRYVHQNPPGRHGAHHYPLDAGLPPAEVSAAFHPYQQSWPSGPALFTQPS
jgi:Sulfotransferase family